MTPHHLWAALLPLIATSGRALAAPEPVEEAIVDDVTDADSPAAPTLGPVAAIELDRRGEVRGHTRNATDITAVLEALGSTEAWSSSGIPRCRPSLWGRLVPPSGEGGSTFQFCHDTSPGHVWVEGHGAFVLPEAQGKALHAVASSLALPHDGAVAPTLVTQHLGQWSLTATIRLENEGPGLRSVTMASGSRLEPDAVAADGTPLGWSAPLTEEQSAALTQQLAGSGFFHRADRTQGPAAETVTAPAGWVDLTVTTSDGPVTWHEANAAAIFRHTLEALRRGELPGEAASKLEELAARLP